MACSCLWAVVVAATVMELKVFIGDGSLQPLQFTVRDDAVRVSERFCEAFNIGYEDCKNIEHQIATTQRASMSAVRCCPAAPPTLCSSLTRCHRPGGTGSVARRF